MAHRTIRPPLPFFPGIRCDFDAITLRIVKKIRSRVGHKNKGMAGIDQASFAKIPEYGVGVGRLFRRIARMPDQSVGIQPDVVIAQLAAPGGNGLAVLFFVHHF